MDDVMFGPLYLGMSAEEAKKGQKRLVSIAGILAMKPHVIALDEPTSDLDLLHAGIIEGIIRADRICVVKKVSLVAEGTPADIFYDASILEESGLKKPDIVRIYESLCKGMCLEQEDRPVNVEALVRCISSKAKK